MAGRIVIDGYEYPLPEQLTFREMHIVKRLTQLTVGQLWEAYLNRDSDLAVAYAAVALKRAGRAVNEDDLLDRPFNEIDLDFSYEPPEGDDGPPAGGRPADNAGADETPAT